MTFHWHSVVTKRKVETPIKKNKILKSTKNENFKDCRIVMMLMDEGAFVNPCLVVKLGSWNFEHTERKKLHLEPKNKKYR